MRWFRGNWGCTGKSLTYPAEVDFDALAEWISAVLHMEWIFSESPQVWSPTLEKFEKWESNTSYLWKTVNTVPVAGIEAQYLRKYWMRSKVIQLPKAASKPRPVTGLQRGIEHKHFSNPADIAQYSRPQAVTSLPKQPFASPMRDNIPGIKYKAATGNSASSHTKTVPKNFGYQRWWDQLALPLIAAGMMSDAAANCFPSTFRKWRALSAKWFKERKGLI